MGAAQNPITIEQGATYSVVLSFNEPNNSDGSPGEPINVSAWSFAGQIRANYSSPVDIQAFSFAPGTDTNEVVMSITAANTSLIPVKPTQNYQITGSFYAYDVFATLPDTSVMKILYGPVIVIPKVTQ